MHLSPVESLIARAVILCDQKNWAQAEKLFRQAMTEAPRDAWVVAMLSISVGEQQRYVEAEDLAERATEMDPGLHEARLALARVRTV
jgi:Tfp pilus assembly protein PilF